MSDTSASSRSSGAESQRPIRLLHRLRGLLGRRHDSVRETLEELIDDREAPEAPIDHEERVLLKNILTLREISADDVMVPRAHVIAVEVSTSFADLVTMINEAAHSRMPVFRETLDDVLGMVHIKDVLAQMQTPEPPELKTLLRPVLFVPPSRRALDLLFDMRQQRTHLAMVVDEYGGIDGLVTIEDLVEQIVGEIEDEHDDETPPALAREEDGTILAEGGVPIEDLEEIIGRFLSDEELEEIDTLGGLVTTLAGRVPEAGERFTHPSGIVFEVVSADPRRVASVRLSNLPEPQDP
jgi:CBS domain containing-hemolysin-like protein